MSDPTEYQRAVAEKQLGYIRLSAGPPSVDDLAAVLAAEGVVDPALVAIIQQEYATKVCGLEQQLAALRAEKDELRARSAERGDTIATLNEQLATVRAEVERLEAEKERHLDLVPMAEAVGMERAAEWLHDNQHWIAAAALRAEIQREAGGNEAGDCTAELPASRIDVFLCRGCGSEIPNEHALGCPTLDDPADAIRTAIQREAGKDVDRSQEVGPSPASRPSGDTP